MNSTFVNIKSLIEVIIRVCLRKQFSLIIPNKGLDDVRKSEMYILIHLKINNLKRCPSQFDHPKNTRINVTM